MIPDHVIRAVREKTDIVRLVDETVKLKRSGPSFSGLCPFHKERRPSFSVHPERGVYVCFACHEKGSAIDFVMKIEGKSFPEAVRMLAERVGIPLEDNRTEAERREAAAARRAIEDLYTINGIAATFYEQALRGPKAHHAVAELARRGLPLDNPAIAAFRIGYAPNAWDALVTYLQKQGVSPAMAERAGLIVPRTTGGYYDRFRHRLMFAVLDVQGRVVAFSGRSLPGGDERETAKYINSPESPIYTKGEHLFGLYQARTAIRQSNEIVMVEGNFDVVGLHAREIGNVVAPLGTAFTENQARLLRRFAPNVTLMLDGDAAGMKATWAAREPLRAAGLSARAVAMPSGMDPDELAQKRGAEAVRALLAAAPPLPHRLLDVLLRDGEFEGKPVHDQAERVRAAIRLIEEAGDGIERTMLRSYADQLTKALRVGSLRELDAVVNRPAKLPARLAARPPAVEQMSLGMLGAILDWPALLALPETDALLVHLDGPAVLAILAMRQCGATLEAVDRMPEGVRAFAAQRLAAPLYETQDAALRAMRAFAKKIAAVNLRAPKDAA